jgi:hypothetical protein
MNRNRLISRTQFLAIAAGLLMALRAEAVTVSGKLLDKDSGESIPGVAVQVKGGNRGIAANVEGFFSLADLQSGQVTLTFTALGYRGFEKELDLSNGQDKHLILKMEPSAIEMQPVKIEAERRGREERKYTPQVALINIETKELGALPQLMEADLFRSMQVLPGVLPTSDFSADLNIWGGSSDQNLILLNGIDVYKPTHLGGLFSVFNMDAVKDVKLIKGGFGAKYGGRLSAVVDVADREGNRNRFHGKTGVSLLSSNSTLEGPLPHGSWLLAGRRTYLDWATKTLKNNGVIDYDFPYYFYDLNAKLTRDFANGDRLTPSAYLGRDILNITSTTGDRIRLVWGNTTYSLPYVKIWSHKLFSTNTVAGSYYQSDFRFESGDEYFAFKNNIRDFTLKTDLSWFANARNTFDVGVQAKSYDIKFFIGGRHWTWVDRHHVGWHYAAYAADDFRWDETLTFSPGVRFERDEIAEATDVLPRFAMKKQFTDKTSINASWGMYSQYLQLCTLGQNMASLFDSYVPLDNTLKPNHGQQVALTFEHEFESGIKFSTDAYYKRFSQLIEFKRDITDAPNGDYKNRPLSDLFNQGEGYAYGWDAFLQGEWDRYTFMLGYGIGRSNRKFEAIDVGRTFPAYFDRLHNTNLFVSRKFGKRRSLEMRFSYGTGQPVTRAEGLYDGGFNLPIPVFVPGEHNGYRLPAYNRLDIAYRLRYEFKRWTFSPYLEVINVYNHKNPLTFNYDLKKNPIGVEYVGQLPFLPSLGFTAEF